MYEFVWFVLLSITCHEQFLLLLNMLAPFVFAAASLGYIDPSALVPEWIVDEATTLLSKFSLH